MKKGIIILTIMGILCNALTAFAAPEPTDMETPLTGPHKSYVADAKAAYLHKEEVCQLITLEATESTAGLLQLWKKEAVEGKTAWKEVLSCHACFGSNGLGKSKEGDCKTPIGDFGMITAFGILEDPGSKLPYYKVTEDTYCCGDPSYYNRIIEAGALGHTCQGEHMIDYKPYYNYGIFFDYNKSCEYGKGSAIFLHCDGGAKTTHGCIGVPEDEMKRILQSVDSNARIIIDYRQEK